MKEKPNAKHALPIGAVVIFKSGYDQPIQKAELIIVQHSRDCDKTPLYMAAEKPIAPPEGPDYVIYSLGYLMYRLNAGWYVGNASTESFYDTKKRVKVTPFLKTPEAKRNEGIWYLSIGDVERLQTFAARIRL
jgi:hypothetical protein